MRVPPVFCPDDLKADVIDDLRDASAAYWRYGETPAFDKLILVRDRHELIQEFIAGDASPNDLVRGLREWLLRPWHSTRSLTERRMPTIARALSEARPAIASFPVDLQLEDVNAKTLAELAKVFNLLDDCEGVGATIASKLLAPLRPALFPDVG